MMFTTIAEAKRITGLTYLGKVNYSTKHEKAWKYNEMTYCLYLAPSWVSGYNTCPKATAECKALCLHKSGKNIGEMNGDMITNARIKKTKLFYEERALFMGWLIAEIKRYKAKAEKEGYTFSVRLNNTSDISPEAFIYKNKNILQLFPDVQFYDYTKVPNRVKLTKKYDNYDLTFSYSGENTKDCLEMLTNNVRVAVVFQMKQLPETFLGYKVIDGDANDLRYKDDKQCIVGLKFKVVRNKVPDNSKFVVRNLAV